MQNVGRLLSVDTTILFSRQNFTRDQNNLSNHEHHRKLSKINPIHQNNAFLKALTDCSDLKSMSMLVQTLVHRSYSDVTSPEGCLVQPSNLGLGYVPELTISAPLRCGEEKENLRQCGQNRAACTQNHDTHFAMHKAGNEACNEVC